MSCLCGGIVDAANRVSPTCIFLQTRVALGYQAEVTSGCGGQSYDHGINEQSMDFIEV